MTLGELIEKLEALDPDLMFPDGFGEPDSWRGVYSEIAFAPAVNVTAGEMLEHAKSALGATFSGYKGGDYTMSAHTDAHIDGYGCYSGDDAAITKWRWELMLMKAEGA